MNADDMVRRCPVNADDMVTGPDGRIYRVLGARVRNEGTRIVEVVELVWAASVTASPEAHYPTAPEIGGAP